MFDGDIMRSRSGVLTSKFGRIHGLQRLAGSAWLLGILGGIVILQPAALVCFVLLAVSVFWLLLSIPELDLLHPASVILFVTTIYLGLKPFAGQFEDIQNATGVHVEDFYAQVFLLAALSVVGFVVGARACRSSIDYVPRYTASEYFWFGVVLALISAGCYLAYGLVGGFGLADRSRLVGGSGADVSEGKTVGYLIQAQLLGVPGVGLMFGPKVRGKRFAIAALVFTLVVFFALSSGFRSRLVYVAGPALIVYMLRERFRPSFLTSLLWIGLALGIFSLMSLLRNPDILEITVEDVTSSRGLLGDTNIIDAMSVVLYHIPDRLPYLWGESFTYIPKHALPREWFPDKGVSPEINAIWEMTGKENGYAIPFFGVLYMNFGYVGPLLGFWFIGYVSSLVYNTALSSSDEVWALVLLSSYLLFLFGLWSRPHIANLVSDAVFVFGPLGMLSLFSRLRPQRGRLLVRPSSVIGSFGSAR